MNTRLLSLAILLLGSGSAYASDVPNAREVFRQLDTNGDRAIQFSEIQAARAALFDRLDTNGDGFLDAEELRTAAQRVGGAARRGDGIWRQFGGTSRAYGHKRRWPDFARRVLALHP